MRAVFLVSVILVCGKFTTTNASIGESGAQALAMLCLIVLALDIVEVFSKFKK